VGVVIAPGYLCAVSAYSIDAASGTAQEMWRFDYGQTIFTPYCSSAYELPGTGELCR